MRSQMIKFRANERAKLIVERLNVTPPKIELNQFESKEQKYDSIRGNE
jgi:hypothetical protein